MNTKRNHIVDAAKDMFIRYGYARTTMADIAKAAGLSRPTLYLSFSDKEQIYRAVLEAIALRKLAIIRNGLESNADMEWKLFFACETWTIEGFLVVQNNPDARDLFDIGVSVVREAYEGFEEMLSAILANGSDEPSRKALGQQYARMISLSLKGFKDLASDVDELRSLIRCLTETVTVALRTAS